MTRHARVLVTTRHDSRRGKSIQFVGALHLELLLENAVAPIPVLALTPMAPHLERLLENADGLLLTEGGDLGPELRPLGSSEPGARDEVDSAKDAIEAALIHAALDRDLPILGICRGMELINTILGGDLYDDLPTDLGTTVCHTSDVDYHGHRHPVTITPGSPLDAVYAQEVVSVTSYHHQGIRRLAPSLAPMASSPDGLVEAFYHPDHTFVWGLQFHPERQLADDPRHAVVHAHFAAAAQVHARGRS